MEGRKQERADCQPNTPVAEKVRRWNLKTSEYKEGNRPKTGKKREGSGRKKEDNMIQPTLSSFMSLRSGLVGAGDKARPKLEPSPGEGSPAPSGKGLETGPKEGSHLLFGEGRKRPVGVSEGSPEHILMKEAGLIRKKEDHSSRVKETELEQKTIGFKGRKEGRPRPQKMDND